MRSAGKHLASENGDRRLNRGVMRKLRVVAVDESFRTVVYRDGNDAAIVADLSVKHDLFSIEANLGEIVLRP